MACIKTSVVEGVSGGGGLNMDWFEGGDEGSPLAWVVCYNRHFYGASLPSREASEET